MSLIFLLTDNCFREILFIKSTSLYINGNIFSKSGSRLLELYETSYEWGNLCIPPSWICNIFRKLWQYTLTSFRKNLTVYVEIIKNTIIKFSFLFSLKLHRILVMQFKFLYRNSIRNKMFQYLASSVTPCSKWPLQCLLRWVITIK